jgi:hypothetical protein
MIKKRGRKMKKKGTGDKKIEETTSFDENPKN